MDTLGLLVTLEAKPDKVDEVVELLRSARGMVERERETTAWFAVRFGRSTYGIFDAFPSEEARQEHLRGSVAEALTERADLFTVPPQIQKLDVLAEKLPPGVNGLDAKGLLLRFLPKSGHEGDVERFLRDAQSFVQREARTTAWFAIRLDSGEYGIFDAFPDPSGRFAHLTGRVPRELAKHALGLLGGMPHMKLLDVVAEKLPNHA
jgi:quinol monooxygenase YgiN